MKNLFFYNAYHNGDIHYSREFVKDIMSKLNIPNVCYLHNNNKSILKDLNISYTHLNNYNICDTQKQIIEIGDNLFINTWVGQLGSKYLKQDCTIYSNYEMYKDIYKQLNIEIEDLDFYLPQIDFSKIDNKNIIDAFVNKYEDKKKILVCNGNVFSGQCPNFSFDNIVKKLQTLSNEYIFILTNDSDITNVFFTKYITKLDYDLNEISYLSTKCDIIVGRASGPHAFTHIKQNYFNENKTFIAFTSKRSEGNWYNSEICDQEWSNDFSEENIYNVIKNKMKL